MKLNKHIDLYELYTYLYEHMIIKLNLYAARVVNNILKSKTLIYLYPRLRLKQNFKKKNKNRECIALSNNQ